MRPVEGQCLRVARLRSREVAQLAEDIAEVAHGVGEGERIVPLPAERHGFPGPIPRFRRVHSRLATGCYPPRGTGAEVWPLRMRQGPASWTHSIVTAPP